MQPSVQPSTVRRRPTRRRDPARKLLSLSALQARLQRLRAQGARIVLTNGCFDLLHVGHVRYLQQAADLGDVLVVGLNSDASTRLLKDPGRPIIPEAERAELLCALECVDYVVLFHERTAEGLVEALRPHYYVKGGDYTEAELPEAQVARRLGGQVRIMPMVEGHSTTGVIETILQRYRGSRQ